MQAQQSGQVLYDNAVKITWLLLPPTNKRSTLPDWAALGFWYREKKDANEKFKPLVDQLCLCLHPQKALLRTPQVLCRVRYQKSKPNLSTFLQKVLPPISEIEPNQISILYYIQHRWIIDQHMEGAGNISSYGRVVRGSRSGLFINVCNGLCAHGEESTIRLEREELSVYV